MSDLSNMDKKIMQSTEKLTEANEKIRRGEFNPNVIKDLNKIVDDIPNMFRDFSVGLNKLVTKRRRKKELLKKEIKDTISVCDCNIVRGPVEKNKIIRRRNS